jgi:uncharacterized membrane protein YeaQ/YmgE (transglycosylase-associated protein family)
MLEGIEILTSNEIYTVSHLWANIFGVVVWVIVSLLSGWLAIKVDCEPLIGFGILFGLACGVIVGSIVYSNTPEVYSHTEYKVTISEEVNFNEFNERYEIIEQEGKIYTIIERE